MNWPVPKPEFCTRTDGATMGEKSERKRCEAAFEFWFSLFAGDCALFFNTRSGLITGTIYLFNRLRKYGLLMHVGNVSELSKTEAIYFP